MGKKYKLLIIITALIGLVLRFWHIEFGLPHSFYADEPEIVELAVKYTYEIRDIVTNKDFFKLIPISFVYGTFPAYLLTLATMVFSKLLNIFGMGFDKTTIYIFLRSITAVISLIIAPVTSLLYFKIFKNHVGSIICFVLTALNWKFIVHGHYVNSDIILSLLISLSYLTLYNFYKSQEDTKWTLLSGILFGLAVGTKITALITFPVYIYIFIKKKNWKNLAGFIMAIFGTFIITNPFSLIFSDNFILRIWEMATKEAGLVFDSVNMSPFKYLSALSSISTFPVLALSIYGNLKALKESKDKTFHIFLTLTTLTYLIFYSIQSRRVDRWILPAIPVIILYASHTLETIVKLRKSKPIIIAIFFYYLYFPALLLFQFQRHTPKSQAYIWARDNLEESSNKLVYTEEGLDPMNKLLGEKVFQFQVYESEGAQFFTPENPSGYDYIIISSRPMENFKKSEVRKKFPFYTEKWDLFENKISNSESFELIKSFELPKPNLIPLSDVYIYKNLNPPAKGNL